MYFELFNKTNTACGVFKMKGFRVTQNKPGKTFKEMIGRVIFAPKSMNVLFPNTNNAQ